MMYMAAGVPYVASPVGINKRITENGNNGFLASTNEEWISYLSLLINDSELRKKMGANGKKYAIEKYSLDVCYKKLLDILEKINNN